MCVYSDMYTEEVSGNSEDCLDSNLPTQRVYVRRQHMFFLQQTRVYAQFPFADVVIFLCPSVTCGASMYVSLLGIFSCICENYCALCCFLCLYFAYSYDNAAGMARKRLHGLLRGYIHMLDPCLALALDTANPSWSRDQTDGGWYERIV